MEELMKIFVDRVHSKDRKLNRALKKQLKQSLSLHQLDALGFSTYFYLKNTGQAPETVSFETRVVFNQNDYLPVMGLTLKGYQGHLPYRLSTMCLMEIERKLYNNFESKSDYDQKIVTQDFEDVFQIFLQSGYLLKDQKYNVFERMIHQRLENCSKGEQRQFKHYKNLLLIEEVIQDVV